MDSTVETYSGYKSEEYPRRFWRDGVQYDIIEIEDRWYSPDASYFKVFASDAGRYMLRRDAKSGAWTCPALSSTHPC